MHYAHFFSSEEASLVEDFPAGNWPHEAADLLTAEALCSAVPDSVRPVEENTLPSWLWRHTTASTERGTEYNLQQLFDRIAGSTTYKAWKKDLFANEASARAFYDDLRLLLSNRTFVMEPAAMAGIGLDWAYGLPSVAFPSTEQEAATQIDIDNTTVDALLSGTTQNAKQGWLRFLTRLQGKPLAIDFADTVREWGEKTPRRAPRLLIDLNKFYNNEHLFDKEAFRASIRLAVVFLDIQDDLLISKNDPTRALAIGVANSADLLMRLAIPYDSTEGRSTCAAIQSLLTATATEVSAKLAQQLGPCAAFTQDRTNALRIIANRRRAAYGDKNDYEHISILPTPLYLSNCPDLTLAAAARHAWDQAYIAAQRYGLRHLNMTSLFTTPDLNVLLGSNGNSLLPLRSLVKTHAVSDERFERTLHPALTEGLTHLGYTAEEIENITHHVLGSKTLEGAPCINREALMARGFTDIALSKIEDYLSEVTDIRLAVTPWIVGENFCREALHVTRKQLDDFSFDLLSFLGFSQAEVVAANHYCYGHGSVETAEDLKYEHRAIFQCADEIPQMATLQMASAVQCFVTGTLDLVLEAQNDPTHKSCSDLVIEAWQGGLKGFTLTHAPLAQVELAPAETQPLLAKPHRRLALGKPAPQSALPKAKPILALDGRKNRAGVPNGSVMKKKSGASKSRKAPTKA